MGLFGHWYVIVILVLLFILLVMAPSTLAKMGTRFGRRVKETKDATIVAGRSFKDEVQKEDEPPK